MAIHTLTSGKYPGIRVQYSYDSAPPMASYNSQGAFNGGTPQVLDITIENILIEKTSILDYVSLTVWEGLEEEIAAKTQWNI